MHREGHIGAALLGYAPVGFIVLALGFSTAAVGGAVVAGGLAMLPDYDMKLPGIKHRGVTHTVHFAALCAASGAIVGGAVAMLHPALDPLDAVGLAIFGAAVGGVTILSHIGADALTPMGVEPLGDDGPHISYDVCRADSTLGNYGLLALGAIGAAVGYGIGAGVNAALPV